MQIDNNASSSVRRRGKPVSRPTVIALAAGFLFVILLRHDFWNWHTPRPLLLGLIPVALWWQALVSISASILMWACVRFAWPEHLEDLADEPPKAPPEA